MLSGVNHMTRQKFCHQKKASTRRDCFTVCTGRPTSAKQPYNEEKKEKIIHVKLYTIKSAELQRRAHGIMFARTLTCLPGEDVLSRLYVCTFPSSNPPTFTRPAGWQGLPGATHPFQFILLSTSVHPSSEPECVTVCVHEH